MNTFTVGAWYVPSAPEILKVNVISKSILYVDIQSDLLREYIEKACADITKGMSGLIYLTFDITLIYGTNELGDVDIDIKLDNQSTYKRTSFDELR